MVDSIKLIKNEKDDDDWIEIHFGDTVSIKLISITTWKLFRLLKEKTSKNMAIIVPN